MMSGNSWNPAAAATTGATGGLGGSLGSSVPPYAQGSGWSSGSPTPGWGGLGGSLGGFNPGMFGSGLGGLLGGLFSNSGGPFSDAMQEFQKWMQQGMNVQNPFLQAGQGAIGDYQKWLSGMKDPSQFINSQMSQYQQSPWAQYEQNQAIRSGQNAASMGGLPNGMGGAGAGSTPFAQQLQQNATNISSQDMQKWLGNVLGVNSQYGAGLNNMMGMGAHSADELTDMFSKMAQGMGGMAYGKGAAQNNDFLSELLGGLRMFGSFF